VRLLERLSLKAPGFVVVLSVLILARPPGRGPPPRGDEVHRLLRAGSEIYRGWSTSTTRMGGTTPLEIVPDLRGAGVLRTEEGLRAIAAAAAGLDAVPEAANVRVAPDADGRGPQGDPPG